MGLFDDAEAQDSAGLFPSAGAAKKKKKSFNWGDAALAAFGVPVEQLRDRRMKRALMEQNQIKFQQQQAEQAQLDAAIESDPLLNTPQLKAYAKANPKAYIENVMQRFQPRQFAAGGGSLGLPNASGKLDFQTAPRFDDNGTIYGPGNGATTPPVLQRGTKAIPLQPGGRTDIVDAITGEPKMAPMSSGPPPEAVNYLRQHPELAPHFDQKYGPGASSSILGGGGAGPQAPRMFPGAPF